MSFGISETRETAKKEKENVASVYGKWKKKKPRTKLVLYLGVIRKQQNYVLVVKVES